MATIRITTPFALLVLALAGCSSVSEPETEIDEDPCTAATPIEVGQSMGGRLDEGDCLQPDGALGDRWSLELTVETSIQIDLTSAVFDPLLELRSRSGAVLALNDDSGSLNSRINQTLPAGSYLILARSYAQGMSGAYQLTVAEGPDCSSVGALELGQAVSGSVSSDDCVLDELTVDNWTLELATARDLRIDLESPDFDEIVLLRDDRGQVWQGAESYGPSGHARIESEVPAGTWTVSVGGFTAAGSYTLLADLAPPCSPGTELTIGATASGEISSEDCLFEGWAPADSFAVTLESDAPIDIHLKSADFEPLLVLRDESGVEVGVGWDERGDGNARIRTSLGAGTYALFVLTYDWPSEGAYQLSVAEVVCGVAGNLGVQASASGQLTPDDCVRAGGAYQDLWALDVTTDGTVRIDLRSSYFDAFLTLSDELGNVIATDDDDGSGLDARIQESLTAGSYTIAASSFAPDQIGAYVLETSDVVPVALAVAVGGDAAASETTDKSDLETPSELLDRLRRDWERAQVPRGSPFETEGKSR